MLQAILRLVVPAPTLLRRLCSAEVLFKTSEPPKPDWVDRYTLGQLWNPIGTGGVLKTATITPDLERVKVTESERANADLQELLNGYYSAGKNAAPGMKA